MAASRPHEVPGQPADLVAALSLTAGTAYNFQNLSSNDVRFFQGAVTADNLKRTRLVGRRADLTFTVESGEPVNVWGAKGPALIIVDEVG